MITTLNFDEIEYVSAAGGTEGGKSSGASVPEVVAEAVVGFVVGLLDAWTDGK